MTTVLSKTAIVLVMLHLLVGGQALDFESVGEKIMKKIASALEKSVIRAGNTCGLPKINNVMKNLTLNEGDTARFQCSVDMKCMVSYIQWYHQPFNDTPKLLRTGASSGNPYSYVIKDVSSQSEGFYSCVAGNTLGETIITAYLEIAGAASLGSSLSVLFTVITLEMFRTLMTRV